MSQDKGTRSPQEAAQHRLPAGELIPLALQHVIVMVVGCITVPIIVSTAGKLSAGQQISMIQASLLCSGVAILVQVLSRRQWIGSGLPVVVGSGFAFIATMSAIASTDGIAYVFGAQLVAALCGMLFGVFYRHIKLLFAPVVKAVVVMTIGISLYKTAVLYMAGGAGSAHFGTPAAWGLALFTLLATLFFGQFMKGFFKIAATLMGLITGYVVALLFGFVSFDAMSAQPVFALPKLLPFGLQFSLPAILPFVVIALISAVQDIGQVEATTFGLWSRESKDKEVRGAIIGNNIGSLVGALFGGAPNAIAGQNVGIVVTTKVIERIVFILAGGLLLLIGFFPVVAAAFLTIPYPVLGGATVAVFGSIAVTGMKMLQGAGFTRRNMTIAGLSLALAIGITYHPEAFKAFPGWVGQIFGNAVVVAALCSIAMNLLLPRDQEVQQ